MCFSTLRVEGMLSIVSAIVGVAVIAVFAAVHWMRSEVICCITFLISVFF